MYKPKKNKYSGSKKHDFSIGNKDGKKVGFDLGNRKGKKIGFHL